MHFMCQWAILFVETPKRHTTHRVRGAPVDVSISLDGAGQHIRLCDVTTKCHAQSFVSV